MSEIIKYLIEDKFYQIGGDIKIINVDEIYKIEVLKTKIFIRTYFSKII